MFVRLLPIDTQSRSTTKVRISNARPVAATALDHSTTSSTVSSCPDLHSPSECFIALETSRDQACDTQHTIKYLWTTLTYDISPARSTLRNLSRKEQSDIRFLRLQSLINKFIKVLNADLDMNLKFNIRGAIKLNVVATIIHREQRYLAHFLEMWEMLEPHLHQLAFCGIAWSKEVFDLLELMLQTMRRLQDQLCDVHHDLRNFLDSRKACATQNLEFASASLSASTGYADSQLYSGLRKRGSGSVRGSCISSSTADSSFLLNQRQMAR